MFHPYAYSTWDVVVIMLYALARASWPGLVVLLSLGGLSALVRSVAHWQIGAAPPATWNG